MDFECLMFFLVGKWLFMTTRRQALFEERLQAARQQNAGNHTKKTLGSPILSVQSVAYNASTPPFNIASTHWESRQKGNKKIEWNRGYLLVPSTIFVNGNTKITVLIMLKRSLKLSVTKYI